MPYFSIVFFPILNRIEMSKKWAYISSSQKNTNLKRNKENIK